jgi:hypothetical protein
MPLDQGDECRSLADFHCPALAVKYSFSNFSFKVRSVSPLPQLVILFSSSGNIRCHIEMKCLHFSYAAFNLIQLWLSDI